MQVCLYCSLRKDHIHRPDYAGLQQYTFFKKYCDADVDVVSWYESIRESEID